MSYSHGPWGVTTELDTDRPLTDGLIVRRVQLFLRKATIGDAASDAQLIRAAPALYEALRELVDTLKGPVGRVAYERARAALSQAESSALS